jgi:hypothetical protein
MDTFTMFEQIDECEFTDVPAEVWEEFLTESENPEQ